MLALGKYRREMGQKGGEWTQAKNDYMMTAMGAKKGEVAGSVVWAHLALT